ncbi:MAG: hypothetical protein JWL59_3941 [Chthoniobacteraceae bacterium]|nr:hypothetical protein [Chthoniobacteraceae bacterium]
MAIMRSSARAQKPLRPELLPSGCVSFHRGGGIVASTLPSSFPPALVIEIGRVVMDAFQRASTTHLPLSDFYIQFSGLNITARELHGGALVFLSPATLNLARTYTPPAMHYKTLEDFILHLENYIECWKQFNTYVNLARDKKFSREDENQFLEVKSIIAQGLEAILASAEKQGPKKDEVNALFANAPSLRYLSDMPDAIHNVEAQWHKIYLSLQSLLGQLKVQESKQEKGAGWSLFGKK